MNCPERLKEADTKMLARIGRGRGAALASILGAVILLLIGTISSGMPWRGAATSNHPLFIVLVMNIVTAIIWLAHEYIPVAKRPKLQSSLWGATFLANWMLFLLFFFLPQSLCLEPHKPILQAVAFGIPLLLLSLVAFIPLQRGVSDSHGTSPEPAQIRQWGFALALVIMLLALFAFGVHYGDEAKSRGLINWVEIPAILIVFVLADLGVNLVALAKSVETSTNAAAQRAGEAAGKATTALEEVKSATEQLTSAGSKAEQCFGELKTALEAFDAVQNQLLLDGTTPLNRKLHDYVLLDNARDYWGRLFCFGRSWVPAGLKAEENTKAKRSLLGALFGEFVGRNEKNGCVRRADDDVVCVTLDAAFAQASKNWLDALAKSNGKGLVIWAVTTLLPTEFAFPQLYWGGDAASAKRAEALRDFVGEVLKQCKSSNVREYRRVSVFKGEDAKNFEGLRYGETQCILDVCFVRDGRLGTLNTELMSGWSNLTQPSDLGAALGVDTRPRGKDRFSVLPFHATSPKNQGFLIHRGDRTEMALWVGNAVPTANGWLTLRKWYCDSLHKSSLECEEVAWWSVLDESDTKAAELLEPFALDCGGFRVYTLDLLMIGEAREDGGTTWHAAAISNISFDRTECTVRVVTGEGDLKKIEEAVRGFCNGFKAPEEGQVPAGVKAFGTWRNWPKAMWAKV